MNIKLKILYLASNPTYSLKDNSGYAIHMREIINAFRENGHRVKTIIGRNGDKKKDIGKVDIGTNSKIKLIKGFIPNFLWQSGRDYTLLKYNKKLYSRLLKIVNEFKPDIIYERAEYLSTSGVEIARKFCIPIFVETNAILVWEQEIISGKSFFNLLGRRYEEFIYKKCRAIFAISIPLKENIIKEYGINEQKIAVVSNGVNPKDFKPATLPGKVREKLDISREEIVVGYVGSIFPWHGIENLIDSAIICLKEMPNLRFLIVGDGETRKGLEEKTRESEICDKVIFTGRVPREEVPDYLQIMDICVYPGSKDFPDRYGSPMKNFEYGIMCKPIISPNSRVVREAMKNGIDGILITPGSVSELSEAILKLAKNPALRKELGENFKRKVIAHYTWDKVGEKILKIIESTLNDNRREI